MSRSDKYRYKIAQFKNEVPKPKKNEVVLIPRDNRLMEIPPFLNSESLPKWWKSLPKYNRSMRRCQATFDHVSYGFTIPAWTNFDFRVNQEKEMYEYRSHPFANEDHIFGIDGFDNMSATGCPLENVKSLTKGEYIKLINPWSIFTEPGTSVMVLPVVHSFNKNFIVMPGIVNTDFYHQLNIVLTILTTEPFSIKAGEPLAHIIPIKRKDNFTNIVWGNESMHRFIAGNGLGEGCIDQRDNSLIYRKFQKDYDSIAENTEKSLIRKIKNII